MHSCRLDEKNCNWTWKTFFPCRCTTVIVPLFGGHYKSWVRPLDKEKKFISSLSAPRPRILCMVYPLSMPQPSSHQFVLPRPLFILRWKPWWSFHTMYTPHTQYWTPPQWTFSMAEPHKLNRKVQKINWKGQKNEKTSDLGRSALEFYTVPNVHISFKK